MNVKINSEIIKKEREVRAWSQQHLADVSSLSLRTIQRIENTNNASHESTKAIACALGLKPSDVYLKSDIQNNIPLANSNAGVGSLISTLNEKYSYSVIAVLTPILIFTYFILYASSASAEPDSFMFSGEVKINDSSPHAFDIKVRSKQVYMMDLDDEHKILFITPDKNSKRAETEVRLLKYNTHNLDIMHKAVVIGSNEITRKFSYRICEGKSMFYNRVLKKIPSCKDKNKFGI